MNFTKMFKGPPFYNKEFPEKKACDALWLSRNFENTSRNGMALVRFPTKVMFNLKIQSKQK